MHRLVLSTSLRAAYAAGLLGLTSTVAVAQTYYIQPKVYAPAYAQVPAQGQVHPASQTSQPYSYNQSTVTSAHPMPHTQSTSNSTQSGQNQYGQQYGHQNGQQTTGHRPVPNFSDGRPVDPGSVAHAPTHTYSPQVYAPQVYSPQVYSPQVYAPAPYQPSQQVEGTVAVQSGAQLVLGLYGPNTRAVCQAGIGGTGYFNCQQLVNYDLKTGYGENVTSAESGVVSSQALAAQPHGSFYGAHARHRKISGSSSSYCQTRNVHAGETFCVVDASAGHDGAWAKLHFKRSQD